MENNVNYSDLQLELLDKILNERIKLLELTQSRGYKKEIKDIHAILKEKPRKEPLVIKVADFTHDKHEPGFDVEVFINNSFAPVESWVVSTKDLKKPERERVYKKVLQEICYKVLKLMV
jgi:hypothetical protein